jgi:hypothetical protein
VCEVLGGSPIGEVAARYGTSRQSLYSWRQRCAALTACGGHGSGGASSPTPAAAGVGHSADHGVGPRHRPPWPAPAEGAAAVKDAGLPMLGAEGTAEHIHVHLDILVNGQPVTVPQEIGIDNNASTISALHTHDTTGIVHVESPVPADFTLGQFFTEWQVSLTGAGIGGLHANGADQFHAYDNGTAYTGDHAAMVLHANDQITSAP